MNRIVKWFILRYLKKKTKDLLKSNKSFKKQKEVKMKKKMKKNERSGIKTTEFWVTLISGIIVAVCNAFKVDPQIRDAIVKLAVAYITSRTIVKISENVKKGGK